MWNKEQYIRVEKRDEKFVVDLMIIKQGYGARLSTLPETGKTYREIIGKLKQKFQLKEVALFGFYTIPHSEVRFYYADR